MTTVYDVLSRPLVTEKSSYQSGRLNQYSFIVADKATRKQVKDASGNRMLVGLTTEENAEFRAIEARDWQSRTDEKAFPWESVEHMHAEKKRWRELHNKHEAARLVRVGKEMIEQQRVNNK